MGKLPALSSVHVLGSCNEGGGVPLEQKLGHFAKLLLACLLPIDFGPANGSVNCQVIWPDTHNRAILLVKLPDRVVHVATDEGVVHVREIESRHVRWTRELR